MNHWDIDITIDDVAWENALPDLDGTVRSTVAAAVAALSPPPQRPVEVSIVLSDDSRVRQLNRDWRGQDKPTNVLSFPAGDPSYGTAAVPLHLGDVVVARQTVLAEAAAQGKPVGDHLRHLLVHGILHLGGYDHQDEAAAAVMEGLERQVLAELGVPDPYGWLPGAAGHGMNGT